MPNRVRCAATVQSSKLSLSESELALSKKVPLAVSMPSAEYHRRLLRDDADAAEQLTARDTGDDIAVEDRERG